MSIQGKRSGLKCKPEASAPKLIDFVKELVHFSKFMNFSDKIIRIVTDDEGIQHEIQALSEERFMFVTEPAPKRVPDKVPYFVLLCLYVLHLFEGEKRWDL